MSQNSDKIFRSRDVKRKGKAGRPMKLNEELIVKIANAIMLGLNNRRTCDYVGISEHSFVDWRRIGEEDLKKGRKSIYSKLFQAVKKAESQSMASRLARITEAEKEQWQAAAWFLERKFPDEWGRKDRCKMEGEIKLETILGALPSDIAGEVGKLLIRQISSRSDKESGE